MASVSEYIAAGAVPPSPPPVVVLPIGDAVASPTDKPVSKRKESRRRRLARHGHWVRFRGRYLDIGQYYITEPEPCGLVYLVERKGEQLRYRALGCGDRTWCPVCCCYHRDKLAADAAGDMLAAIQGLEIAADVIPRDFGTKLVKTVPKETSAWIDTSDDRWEKLALVRKASAAFDKKMWPGSTGVIGLDFTGESDPVDAHYHVNTYLFPAVRLDKQWFPVDTYIRDLPAARRLWAETLREYLGADAPGLVGLDEAVFWSNPLKYPQQLRHWLRYLYRGPLYDLWKGWDKVDGLGLVHYKVWKLGGESERVYTQDEILVAMERVANTPRKWKRVVWFGAFSDGQKTKTMASLGLEKVVKSDEEEEEGWQQVGESLRFKRFLPWRDGGGIVLLDKAGAEVVVPEGVINYGPSGVTLGRRIRYEPPGGR